MARLVDGATPTQVIWFPQVSMSMERVVAGPINRLGRTARGRRGWAQSKSLGKGGAHQGTETLAHTSQGLQGGLDGGSNLERVLRGEKWQ
jgi:hypothetical protein